MKEKIKQLARDYYAEVIDIRRHLHQYPELSFEEVETGKFIAARLASYGIDYEHGIAGNGVVGIIRGEDPNSKIIALRADMDALPIQETTNASYQSKREGVMHACGHDVHTASLLGVSKILQAIRSEIKGTIKLIFQPGEEKLPGGASIMIEEGVLENPSPSHIFGQHVFPSLEAGKVGFRSGMYMASCDELYLTIKGKGGHGALPHTCVDTVLMTAHIITALQQVVSRMGNPTIPSVLTFGKINSTGGATNIIPEEVKLEGTFRTLNEEWRAAAHQKMKQLVEQMAASMGGEAVLNIVSGYPFLQNDITLTERAKVQAINYLGKENVVELPIRMTAEDFAWYSQEIPACFYRLGTGNSEKGITASVHNSNFDVDEKSLETSIGLMSWLAYCELMN